MSKRPNTTEAKLMYEGKEFVTKDGHSFIIERYNAYSDVYVRFKDAPLSTFRTTIKAILDQTFRYPFKENSPICFMDNKLKYENTTYKTNDGSLVKVKYYNSTKDIGIQFEDTGYTMSVTAQNLENGQVRNPFKQNQFGGVIGNSKYSGVEFRWLYRLWYNILMRTDANKEYYKKYHNVATAYDDVYIIEAWKNYGIFAEWYMGNISILNPNYTYDVEKDAICRYLGRPNKFYSPETCELVPHEINTKLITRAEKINYNTPESFAQYKAEKEQTIHELAENYYREGALTDRGYNALKNYYINYEDLV